MNLLTSLARTNRNTTLPLSFSDYLSWFTYGGLAYGMSPTYTMRGNTEEIDGSFLGLVDQAYRRNGVVFAAMAARFLLFGGIRFQYQQWSGGKPGRMFGDRNLELLERPWGLGSTTGDLLNRVMVYSDLAGNAFVVRRSSTRLAVPRPDWCTIIMGSPNSPTVTGVDLDAEFLGILYHPGGRGSGSKPEVILRELVAHYAPYPDPLSPFRGMSWLTPIMREIAADSSATSHKLQFFENAATPNMVVSLDKEIGTDAFNEWVDLFEENDEPRGAAWDAYRTIYLGAGAKVEVVGASLQQMDFKVTQGAGETRIAAASGIHPVVLGISEGLAGSSLNVGNFNSARRLTADKTMHPLWQNVSGTLEAIQPPPLASGGWGGVRLWYDASGVPFLREDRKDAAEIQQIKASTIRSYVDAGFTPETAVAAVEAEDPTLLEHTNLYSVQLQPPGTTAAPATAPETE